MIAIEWLAPGQNTLALLHEQGACRGMDPNIFYPSKGQHGSALRAKRVCAACPVQMECRAYGLTANEQRGIWGGLTQRERARILRGRRTLLDLVNNERSITSEAV